MELTAAQLLSQVRTFLAANGNVTWQVEKQYGLPAGLLLAVGSRETNLATNVDWLGPGYGNWQNTPSASGHPNPSPPTVANYAKLAASVLKADLAAFTGNTRAGIDAYNAGVGAVTVAIHATGNPDTATTHGDYGTDVLQRLAVIQAAYPNQSIGSSGYGAAGSAAAGAGQPVKTPGAYLPHVDLHRRSTGKVDSSEWRFPHNPLGNALAEAVLTDSTVNFYGAQLSEIQLTVHDPHLDIFGSLYVMISQKEGYVGLLAKYQQDVLAVTEVQSTTVNDATCCIITLQPAFMAWLSTQRKLKTWGGVSATEWLQDRVAEYNATLGEQDPKTAFMGEITATRPGITLNTTFAYYEWQSYYDMAMQLALQEGYWLFESCGGVYFGEPPWLRENVSTVLKVGWSGNQTGRWAEKTDVDTECIGPPVILRSNVLFTGDTMTLYLDRDVGEQVRPGMGIDLSGVPWAQSVAGGWIVQNVSYALDGGGTAVQVDCNQAKYLRGTEPGGISRPVSTDPTGLSPSQQKAAQTAAQHHPGGATGQNFYDKALSQVGVPYKWGGTTPSPGFDCSGLVQWAAAQLGVSFPHYTGSQYATCQAAGTTISVAEAYKIQGALVFIGNSSGVAGEHVAICVGDGVHVLQAPYTGVDVQVDAVPENAFDVAALIPGVDYTLGGKGGNGLPGPTPS